MATQNIATEKPNNQEYTEILNDFKCRTAGAPSQVINHMLHQTEEQIKHMTGKKVTLVVQEKES